MRGLKTEQKDCFYSKDINSGLGISSIVINLVAFLLFCTTCISAQIHDIVFSTPLQKLTISSFESYQSEINASYWITVFSAIFTALFYVINIVITLFFKTKEFNLWAIPKFICFIPIGSFINFIILGIILNFYKKKKDCELNNISKHFLFNVILSFTFGMISLILTAFGIWRISIIQIITAKTEVDVGLVLLLLALFVWSVSIASVVYLSILSKWLKMNEKQRTTLFVTSLIFSYVVPLIWYSETKKFSENINKI